MTAELEKTSQGHYLLKGQLSFDSVPLFWSEHSSELFADTASSIEIDLSGLNRSDSSGLALLVEWYRSAELSSKTITFVNMPVQMQDIARVSGLVEILPIMQTEQTEG